jgi:hypothetical protein
VKPEDLSTWFPVLRDYTLLVCGVGLGLYGLVAHAAGIASVGWGMVATGAVGRVRVGDNGK